MSALAWTDAGGVALGLMRERACAGRSQAKKNLSMPAAAKLQIARQPVERQAAYVWDRYKQTAKAWLTDLELELREIKGPDGRRRRSGGRRSGGRRKGAGPDGGRGRTLHTAEHMVDTSDVTIAEHTDAHWAAFLKQG